MHKSRLELIILAIITKNYKIRPKKPWNDPSDTLLVATQMQKLLKWVLSNPRWQSQSLMLDDGFRFIKVIKFAKNEDF